MSNAFVAKFNALIPVFKAVGLADSATYTAPGGATIVCSVMVDYNLQSIGQIETLSDKQKLITLFKAEIGAPVRGAVVVVGADSYTLASRTIDDDFTSVWIANQ
jgi:hypothetical protein